MGGRLSVPRGPEGLNEISRPTAPRRTINGRTVVAPLAALTMAGLLFVYSRTSIKAAKLNAQKHREADGGQINWRNESLRRHGQLETVGSDKTLIREALLGEKVSQEKLEAKANAESQRGDHDSEAARTLEVIKRTQGGRLPPADRQ